MIMLTEEEEQVYDRYQELCGDLNLDSQTKEETWKTYYGVKQMYTLEGDQAHWLCCAVYVACRQANVPSIGSPTMHGNYVNLTRLLRTCHLSLVDFFDKSRKWGDMTNLKQEYRNKIERLERNFAVTTVIFKKFDPIFAGIFKDFTRRDADLKANRKKLSFRSAADLFDYCWTLFLCVKSSLRISDDLVNSYHLLLACVDLIFHNVVQAGNKNMLTQQFADLADGIGYDSRGDPSCIIHSLCDLYDGISVEAKTIKEFWLKPKIKNMIEQGVLRGEAETLSGLIDEESYEHNYRRMEKEYEEYVLTEGDFDERMYLSSERQADFGMDSANYEEYLKALEKQPAIKTLTPVQELRHLLPQTPLSCKRFEKEDFFNSPISSATQSVSRLQAILCGRNTEPSDQLRVLLSSCARNPLEGMMERVKALSAVFVAKYTTKNDNQPGFHAEFVKFRSQLGQTLFYRLLESVLTVEKKRENKLDFSDLMADENFQTSLFALSLEIVLYSYKSQKRFPWVLDAFNLDAYHFYKVIELVIRSEENLCRDVVKHLSQVEEKVLEELVWKEDCPIWTVIAEKNDPIPSCEEVFLPSQIDKQGEGGESQPKRYAVIKTPAGEKCVPVAVGGTNQSTLIIQDKTSSQILGVVLPSKHGDKPKKGNSIALFFRKFYHLTFIRLQDLCKSLGVEEELLRKIWTCCQEAIVHHVEDLMKGRHLDQIIMCCVYVVSKVVGAEKTFTDIMRCYRMQPQSASHVYRNVMLTNPEERGDLIKFYNTIFIGRMQKYALRFSNKSDDNNVVPLSPVPNLKATPLSPCRKMSSRHSVFLRPLRGIKTPSPSKQLLYQFSRSPNNTLKAINAMVQVADTKPKAVKRLLAEDFTAMSASVDAGDAPPVKVFASTKFQDFGEGHDQSNMDGDAMD